MQAYVYIHSLHVEFWKQECNFGDNFSSRQFEWPGHDVWCLFLYQALRVSMEEQRQRQEEEARRVTAASGEEAPTPEAPIADSEEAMLQQALSMSTPQTPVFDFSAMTEEQQIEYAMRLSLQNLEAETVADGGGDKETTEKQDEKEEQAGASAMETDTQVWYSKWRSRKMVK